MFCHGKLGDATEASMGLNKFKLWLKELCGKVVLVVHNVWAFDVKSFWSNVKKWNLKYFFRSFVDRLSLSTNIFLEKHSHSQEKLNEYILYKTYVAYNSMEDVIAM